MGEGKETKLEREREGLLGPRLQKLFHPFPCLQVKWNLRLFQAEQHPVKGTIRPFSYTTLASFIEYF